MLSMFFLSPSKRPESVSFNNHELLTEVAGHLNPQIKNKFALVSQKPHHATMEAHREASNRAINNICTAKEFNWSDVALGLAHLPEDKAHAHFQRLNSFPDIQNDILRSLLDGEHFERAVKITENKDSKRYIINDASLLDFLSYGPRSAQSRVRGKIILHTLRDLSPQEACEWLGNAVHQKIKHMAYSEDIMVRRAFFDKLLKPQVNHIVHFPLRGLIEKDLDRTPIIHYIIEKLNHTSDRALRRAGQNHVMGYTWDNDEMSRILQTFRILPDRDRESILLSLKEGAFLSLITSCFFRSVENLFVKSDKILEHYLKALPALSEQERIIETENFIDTVFALDHPHRKREVFRKISVSVPKEIHNALQRRYERKCAPKHGGGGEENNTRKRALEEYLEASAK